MFLSTAFLLFFALTSLAQGQLIPSIPAGGNSNPPSCSASETLVEIEITCDATPAQNKIFIEDECTGQGESIQLQSYQAFQTLSYSFCSETALLDIAKLRLKITDSGGDGLQPSPAGYRFAVGSTVYTGDRFGSEVVHYFGGLQLCSIVAEITGFFECFAGSSTTVHSQTKGVIPIDQLEIGDKVLTSNGKYENVYTIDHRNINTTARFVQIFTDASSEKPALEVTPKHMVFVHGKTDPIPAASLKIGIDQVITIQGPRPIIKISNIVRDDGVYNPITADGTIVLNDGGIFASSYSAHLTGHAEHIEFLGLSTLSHQKFFNKALKPLQFLCGSVSNEFCKLPASPQSSFTEEKIALSNLAAILFKLWSTVQNEMLQAIMIGMVILFIIVIDLSLSGILPVLACSLLLLPSSKKGNRRKAGNV